MKANYYASDEVYKYLRRETNYAGWKQTEEGYEKFHSQFERYREKGTMPSHGRVLGLGCGAGNIMLWFASQGYEATGVDISETAIEWANEKAAKAELKAEFILGSVLNPPLDDSSFDIVVDESCYHCIIGEDRKTFLAEAYRVLKPGGYLSINSNCEPNAPNDEAKENYRISWHPETYIVSRDGQAIRFFPEPEVIIAEVRKAGLSILSFHFEITDIDNQISGGIDIEAIKPSS